MNNTKLNKTLSQTKHKSSFLALLYIFVLTVTIIHHHPIELGNKSLSIKNDLSEKLTFLYTSAECPIVTFAHSGFYSLGIQSFDAVYSSYSNTYEVRYNQEINKLNYPQANYLRGPPSS